MKNGRCFAILMVIFMPFASAETQLSQSQATELARNTLAKQNKLLLKNLEVDAAKAMQWPDSSLGCPQPGMMYAQIITPGYQVTLLDTSSGNIHFVHVGAGRAVVCDKTDSTRTQTEKNLRFGQRWQQTQKAQQLLAERLSVPRNEIRIIGTRKLETDKAGPLCKEEPTKAQMQVIELSYRDRTYRYGIIGNRLVACD